MSMIFENILKKFISKISLGEPKRVLGHFDLNSKKGVKTPRWRILGTKKYYLYSSKIRT